MVRDFHRPPRGAFTLVEMLIAMVLTLILITSIAQFYAIVGDSVKDGRAMIEMGSQMRAAVGRLKADLDLITCSAIPWTDDGSASGYIEYFEGRGNDYNANGNFTAATMTEPETPIVDATEDLLPTAVAPATPGNLIPDLTDLGVTNMVGDGDDFIAFTIRASGQPFSGRYTNPATGVTSMVTSQLAEVIWWVGFEDRDENGRWTFDEPRQIYRRQLLIRPDLATAQLDASAATPATTTTLAHTRLMQLLQRNDISMSVRYNGSYPIQANSLANLCKREYRFGHMPLQVRVVDTPAPRHYVDDTFPHPATTISDPPTTPIAWPVLPLLLPSFSANSPGLLHATPTQRSFVLQGDARGEDVVLSNVLAFDVQVYDPYARLWPDDPGGTSSTALVPSDAGYARAARIGNGMTPPPILGLGAYVDLGYYRNLVDNATAINDAATSGLYSLPYFADLPAVSPGFNALTYRTMFGYINDHPPYIAGATWDTWALTYERDGVDQLGNGTYDLQTNGIDDNGSNGVDDVSERDTVPPYSQPLRGLQVKVRLYEPSTRQVRQSTVATDFITE